MIEKSTASRNEAWDIVILDPPKLAPRRKHLVQSHQCSSTSQVLFDHNPTVITDVARSYDGNGGGEDRPLHTMYLAVAWVALLTVDITDTRGPVPIQFKMRDKQTIMPLDDHAAHWSSYIGEVIR
nr:S-adenosyl-L-methionine-dependent methyltransferases superfamily protein [Tanacetum cinerariifolium]